MKARATKTPRPLPVFAVPGIEMKTALAVTRWFFAAGVLHCTESLRRTTGALLALLCPSCSRLSGA